MKLWKQSKTKMWHMCDGWLADGQIAKCQSYNLDRPNYLSGEGVPTPPEGAKVCKKCLTHLNKED